MFPSLNLTKFCPFYLQNVPGFSSPPALACWLELPASSLQQPPLWSTPPPLCPHKPIFLASFMQLPPRYSCPQQAPTPPHHSLCPSPVCRLPQRTHCGRLPALPVPGTDVEGGQVKGQLSDPYDGNPIPPGEQGGAESSLSCNSLTRLSDQRRVPQAQETSPSLSFQGQRHRKAFPESW